MRRGDVCLVDLEPVRGAEARKRRPAVLVSNDGANATAERMGRWVVTVVPITSNVSRVYPFQVLLTPGTSGLKVISKAQAEQIRSVAIERIGKPIGRLSSDAMTDLDAAISLHLGL